MKILQLSQTFKRTLWIVLITTITSLSTSNTYAEKVDFTKISSSEFLRYVRSPLKTGTWVQLSGKISHHRRASEGNISQEGNIYVALLFAKALALGQVVIDDKEAYTIGQNFINNSTTITPAKKEGYKNSLLAQFGIKPSDLTFSFVYWNFIKELKPESLRGQKCRIFILQDKNTKQYARVYFSTMAMFPMKITWYNIDNKNRNKATKVDLEKLTKEREMEMNSFRKQDDMWIVTGINLYGGNNKWRTRISFTTNKAGNKKDMPQKLFKDFKAKKSDLKKK
ncbi:hypothetical protein AAEX28_04610 [Lentisphaerota bacterium WC36G]|nr:hypothetical protein LJT99_07470 [Lentisphaerae bacterium WC36]